MHVPMRETPKCVFSHAGKTIEVNGLHVSGLAPDEKSISLQLQQALQAASLESLHPTHQTSWQLKSERNAKLEFDKWLSRQPGSRGAVPGLRIHGNESLASRLQALRNSAGRLRIILLHVDGANATEVFQSLRDNLELDSNVGEVVVVLGDSYGMTEEEIGCVMSQPESVSMLSLGKLPLLASQCIVLINHYLDT